MEQERKSGSDVDGAGESAPFEGGLSRRKWLAAMGAAGAAFVMSGMLERMTESAHADGASVQGSVYGGGGPCCDAVVVPVAVAELRATTLPDEDCLYFTTDPGTEGHWQYDPLDTASADNGGTILVGAAGHRFKRLYAGGVNVRWFGAKGDLQNGDNGANYGAGQYATDDTAAIQAALDWLQATGGGELFFPSGNYKITQTLLFDPNTRIAGENKATSRITQYGGGIAVFRARSHSVSSTMHVTFHRLSVYNADITRLADSVGIDMRQCSLSGIYECRFRYHDKAIVLGDAAVISGYYNTIKDTEIASNGHGIHFGLAANAITVEGGRLNSNVVGIYMAAGSSGNRINATFERNGIGIEFTAQSQKNTVVGGYFEGNGRYTGSTYIPGYGAVVFRAGSFDNVIMSSKFSGTFDKVLDHDGRNACWSQAVTGWSPGMRGGGMSVLTNGLMERDSNGDGLADGWKINASLPAGTLIALDAATKATGERSQRITLVAAGTSKRTFYTEIKGLAPGVPYTMRTVMKTDLTNGFTVRLGNSLTDRSYLNAIIDSVGDWFVLVRYFVPTQPNVLLYIEQAAAAYQPKSADANLWIDSVTVNEGIVDTAHGYDKALLPNGNTADRPGNPQYGELYYNRETRSVEAYDESLAAWVGQKQPGYEARAETVDDVPLTVVTLPVQPSSAGMLELSATARDANLDIAAYRYAVPVRRGASGAPVIGSPVELMTPLQEGSLAAAEVIAAIQGNNAVVRVKGPAAATVQWSVRVSASLL